MYSSNSVAWWMETARAPHSSTFTWKIPWMGEPGRLQSVGSWRVGHDWMNSLSLFLSCVGEGNGNPLYLPGGKYIPPGTGEPVGLPSMGLHRVGHNWGDLAAAVGYKNENSVHFSSVVQSCPTFCDPMNRSTPVLPIHHHLPEFTQTHVHQVGDAIQPSHPLSSPSPPAPSPSQHQSLFQWVKSSREVAKVLEFQL